MNDEPLFYNFRMPSYHTMSHKDRTLLKIGVSGAKFDAGFDSEVRVSIARQSLAKNTKTICLAQLVADQHLFAWKNQM